MTAYPEAPVVAVAPGSLLRRHSRLFAAVAAAVDVRFVPCRGGSDPAVAARVRIAAGTEDEGAAPTGATGRTPELVFAVPNGRETVAPVRILAHRRVPRPLRGAVLPGDAGGPRLRPADGEEVLALCDGSPAWIRSRDDAVRVRAGLPGLPPGAALADALRGPDGFALATLVAFLRDLRPAEAPPVRAAIIFDDPNLRRDSYGFIAYRRLADHAERHGYHAAMALIPRDARRWDGRTVALFRARPDQLSLVVHGNDHVSDELLRHREPAAALAVCAQALRRIGAFEEDSGLAVDRVMIPPHGLCSREVARALGALRFDALAAKHPCPWTARAPADRPLAGWTAAEFVDGCAVVPRFHLDADPLELRLRAFLRQPLIIYGHHGDVAGGLDRLATLAAEVERVAGARWCSVGEIARANAVTALRGDVLTVSPWANRVRVAVPEGTAAIAVAAPAGADAGGFAGWSLDGDPAVHAFAGSVSLPAGGPVTVRLRSRWESDGATPGDPAWRPWPHLRRRATEARDRSAPLRARAWSRARR